jgi:endonuclease-3
MDRNVCPVDTHVHRTLNRIGIVATNSPDKTFLEINKNLPQGIAHSFHTNLIRLGREICRPGLPYCSICPLKRVCSFQEKNLLPPPKNLTIPFMLLDNV